MIGSLKIPETIQSLIGLLLCGLLPAFLFITGGIRHWVKRKVTLATRENEMDYQVTTFKGKEVRPVALEEVGLGCFILLMSILWLFLTAFSTWIGGTFNPTSYPEETIKQTGMILIGYFLGLSFVSVGIWIFVKEKTIALVWPKFENERRLFVTITGKPAILQGRIFIFVGFILITIASIFAIFR